MLTLFTYHKNGCVILRVSKCAIDNNFRINEHTGNYTGLQKSSLAISIIAELITVIVANCAENCRSEVAMSVLNSVPMKSIRSLELIN